MKLLIANLMKAIEESKTQAVAMKPAPGRNASYTLGYIQGKFVGLNTALSLVQGYLEDEDKKDDYK
jgi:hypothetical protein